MELEQMKQKYAAVFNAIQQQQVRLSHVHIQDNKLFIQGAAPSDQAKNRVWDSIKQVNPNWSQELTADITVDTSLQTSGAPAQAMGAGVSGGEQMRTYTVQAGDSLSKISKEVYGNANDYMKIFEANRDILNDPNKINPGQKLKIPG
jgi:nucleoid-associated protein YgaU